MRECDEWLPSGAMAGRLQTAGEVTEAVVRQVVPAWRKADLCFWEWYDHGPDGGIHPLQLWFVAQSGVYEAWAPDRNMADQLDAFVRTGAFAGWRMEVADSPHIQLSVKYKYRDDWIDPARHQLDTSSDGVFVVRIVFKLTAPDGREMVVATQQHECINGSHLQEWYFAHPTGHAGVIGLFLTESGRIRNEILRHRREAIPNAVIQTSNTGHTVTMDTSAGWGDLVLPPQVEKNLCDDFHAFLRQEAWYRRNGLPYKRGYLLCGPPGNGKTSVVRAMAATPGFQALTFDFTAKDYNENRHLCQLFKKAGDLAPCFVILEDLDRVFAEGEHVCVTLDSLLNCMDGAASRNGVVVVATANRQDWLDHALRNRPGRFDRVVQLPLPDFTLRRRYLEKLFRRMDDADISDNLVERLAEETSGYSMAALKELFISTGNHSFLRGGAAITEADALAALEQMSWQFSQSKTPRLGLESRIAAS